MEKAIKWYVLSNIHIAICAVVFLIGGFNLFDETINLYLLGFIGIGTWTIYLMHRIIGGRQLSDNYGAQRFEISSISSASIITLVLLAALISAFCFYHLPVTYHLPLIVLGLISMAYILPMLGNGKRLRDIGRIKIFLIATVWAGVFILPYPDATSAITWLQLSVIWIEKALFIFALTLPFDIRDRDLDRSTQVSTLASIMSVSAISKMISGSIFFLLLLVLLSFLQGVYSLQVSLLLAAAYLLQWWLSEVSFKQRHEFYFLLVLDSFILLQGLIHYVG